MCAELLKTGLEWPPQHLLYSRQALESIQPNTLALRIYPFKHFMFATTINSKSAVLVALFYDIIYRSVWLFHQWWMAEASQSIFVCYSEKKNKKRGFRAGNAAVRRVIPCVRTSHSHAKKHFKPPSETHTTFVSIVWNTNVGYVAAPHVIELEYMEWGRYEILVYSNTTTETCSLCIFWNAVLLWRPGF